MWEDEWKHNITIPSDHPKYDNVDWMYGFYHDRYIELEQSKPTNVLWVHDLITAKFFLIKEKSKRVQLEGMFEFVEKLFSAVFPPVFHVHW